MSYRPEGRASKEEEKMKVDRRKDKKKRKEERNQDIFQEGNFQDFLKISYLGRLKTHFASRRASLSSTVSSSLIK